jgi:hypothetical protein
MDRYERLFVQVSLIYLAIGVVLGVAACRVAVFFTGVKLSSGHAGVAFAPIAEIWEAVCCPPMPSHFDPLEPLATKGT